MQCSAPVFILGGVQTDFARCWSREGKDLSDATREAVLGAIENAGVPLSAIESIHVGNGFGELQRNQGHLGAMPATVIPELIGIPAMRHEAACASASIAVLAAMAEIEAGRYDCVLVLGVEEQRNLGGDIASRNMNCAGWEGHEQLPGRYVWPTAFGRIADEYDQRYGLDRGHLYAIARQNFSNARRNPRAQTRGWTFDAAAFTDDEAANPMVEAGVRRNECAQITDGACALILCSARFAAGHCTAGLDATPRITGWGHSSADLAFLPKLARAKGSEHRKEHLFPHVPKTVAAAVRRAGLSSIEDVDGIELHDCFALSEYFLIDHAGLCPPGEARRLIDAGDTAIGGRFPVNPSGGLIGGGHPVGATGTRMLLDACRQVTGNAGDYQVEGAKRFATLNIGGALGTVCAFVVETAAV